MPIVTLDDLNNKNNNKNNNDVPILLYRIPISIPNDSDNKQVNLLEYIKLYIDVEILKLENKMLKLLSKTNIV